MYKNILRKYYVFSCLDFVHCIDIEYNKRLDRQRPCLEGDFSGGSNNIVQSNKSV